MTTLVAQYRAEREKEAQISEPHPLLIWGGIAAGCALYAWAFMAVCEHFCG